VKRFGLAVGVIALTLLCTHLATAQGPLKRVSPRPMLVPSDSSATADIYVTIERRGVRIDGDVTRAGHEGKILAHGFSHEIQSAVAGGRRQYGPVVITKSLDKATPLLLDTVGRGAPIDRVLLEFLGTGLPDGRPSTTAGSP